MNFQRLLCVLFSRLDGEKTANAAYHLLRGKRSGQAIQDVNYYQLQMFYGILPRLSKSFFAETIQELEAQNYIQIDELSILHITNEGRALIENAEPYHFDGWHYRGREEMFFARLSLIIQTLSHFRNDVKQFYPVQRDPEVQHFVKRILRHAPIATPQFSLTLKKELMTAMDIASLTDQQKTILSYRLVGYRQTGWTWQQLGEQLQLPQVDVRLLYIEGLHQLLRAIEKMSDTSFLPKIADGIKLETVLTHSTRQTKSYFEKGYSLDEIALIRQLKLSTIEDHLVEMALNDQSFPLEKFVDLEAHLAVWKKSTELDTKRLRPLKECFPELTYFQLRLILSVPVKGAIKQ